MGRLFKGALNRRGPLIEALRYAIFDKKLNVRMLSACSRPLAVEV